MNEKHRNLSKQQSKDYSSKGGSWYDERGVLLNESRSSAAALSSRMSLWEYLSNESKLFCRSGKLFSPSEVLSSSWKLQVVGNGKSASPFLRGYRKEKKEWIVRFNNLSLLPNKTDVHVVNRWVAPQGRININLECLRPLGCRQKKMFALVPEKRAVLCRGDPSRGFLFVSIFQRFWMTLHGFDSDLSHYHDPHVRVWHNAHEEHSVLRRKYLLSPNL